MTAKGFPEPALRTSFSDSTVAEPDGLPRSLESLSHGSNSSVFVVLIDIKV
jgi:hypothetical protein